MSMKRMAAVGIVSLFLLGLVSLITWALVLSWREGKLWIVLAVFGGGGLLWWAVKEAMAAIDEKLDGE